MCVAIWKPHDKTVKKEDMEHCFRRNPDGAGYMFLQDKKVAVRKGYMTFQEFWDAYSKDAEENPHTGFAIHFRIGTSGEKDEANCHPHVVAEDLAFIHNGVMSEFAYTAQQDPVKAKKSDTANWNDEVIKPLYAAFGKNMLMKADLLGMIKARIGAYNKMIFLSGGPKAYYWILHESGGTWHEGIWYSNMIWKPYERSTYDYSSRTYPACSVPTSAPTEKSTSSEGGLTTTDTVDTKEGWRSRSRVPGSSMNIPPSLYGCWMEGLKNKNNPKVSGRWIGWNEYDRLFPGDEHGPFEYYRRGFKSHEEYTSFIEVFKLDPPRIPIEPVKGKGAPRLMYDPRDLKPSMRTAVALEAAEQRDTEDVVTDADFVEVKKETEARLEAQLEEERKLEEAIENITAPEEVWDCKGCLKKMTKDEQEMGDGLCTSCTINSIPDRAI